MTAQNSGSGARRSSLKNGRSTLSLHIEELVLHGFASIDDTGSAKPHSGNWPGFSCSRACRDH